MANLGKDTLLFAKEFRRMCKSRADNCSDCKLSGLKNCRFGGIGLSENIEKKILDEVQKFHDETQSKTYLEDFLEKFPNCEKRVALKGEYPESCRNMIYGNVVACMHPYCWDCWNEKMP